MGSRAKRYAPKVSGFLLMSSLYAMSLTLACMPIRVTSKVVNYSEKRKYGDVSDALAGALVYSKRLSYSEAQEKFPDVSRQSIRYHEGRLSDVGVSPEAVAAMAQDLPDLPETTTAGSPARGTADGAEASTPVRFSSAVKWATQQLQQDKNLSVRKAAEQASQRFEVDISKSTVERHKHAPGVTPVKRGRPCLTPRELELQVVGAIKDMRVLKLPVYRWCVLNSLRNRFAGMDFYTAMKNGLDAKWYDRFLERHNLDSKAQRPLELKRHEWTKSNNLKRHYDIMEEVLLETGIGIKNPDFKPDEPLSEPVLIPTEKRGRIISFDETGLKLDCTETRRDRATRTATAGKGDTGETTKHKSSVRLTGVGGSTMAGDSIPPLFIWPSDGKVKGAWNLGESPVSTIVRDGKPLEAVHTGTPSGGMIDELGIVFLRKIVLAGAYHWIFTVTFSLDFH
jgi:hypothetical protein